MFDLLINCFQAIKAKGRLIQSGTITHSAPFCWRSDTQLIYRAVPCWFVAVEQIRDKMVCTWLFYYLYKLLTINAVEEH